MFVYVLQISFIAPACQLNVRLEIQLVLCKRLQITHTVELLPLETSRDFVLFHQDSTVECCGLYVSNKLLTFLLAEFYGDWWTNIMSVVFVVLCFFIHVVDLSESD